MDEATSPVTHVGIGAYTTAMVKIGEDLKALADDIVRGDAFYMGDEAHAAAVMLMPRVVQTLPHHPPTQASVLA